MGATLGLGACCGAESSECEEDLKVSVLSETDGNGTFDEELQKLEEGINVKLVLQNKVKITCSLVYDKSKSSIQLASDKKVRIIALKDIKSILKTKDQLKRVEKSAGIENGEVCAAIQFAESGTCIPLFFLSEEDKDLFVTVITKDLE